MAKKPELTFAQWLTKLQDPNASLAQLGLQRLSDLGEEEYQTFQQVWPTIDVKRRRSILASLAELAEDNFEFDFTAVMIQALTDSDATVRTNAIDGLVENTEFTTADRFVALMQNDPSIEVRAAAASSLGKFAYLIEMGKIDRITSKRVREALLATYHKPGEHELVKRRTLEALGYFSPNEMADMISEAYHSGDDQMRASAVFAMGRQSDLRWLDTVLREMDNPNPEMRFEAARAAGELQNESALPKLEELIADSDREVSDAAVIAIGNIGGARAKLVLQTCAKSTDQELREVAEEALSEMEFFEEPLRMHMGQSDDDDHEGHTH